MRLKSNLDVETLKSLLSYNNETGEFTRNIRIGPFKQGTVAGTKLNTGYISIRVNGTYFQAHRLAWLYVTGSWPSGFIDHINHDKSDNRWINLRDVSWSDNLHNLKSHKKQNKSGALGVSKYRNKWVAQIQRHSVKTHIGVFNSKEEASNAYKLKKIELLEDV